MHDRPGNRTATWITLALIGLAAALRLLAARGDLWLDEVWTWRTARELGSLADLFGQRDENNHPLNTLIFYLFGSDQPGLVYRLPAVAAGIATVVCLVGAVEARARRILLLLATFSYPLIHYASEARGYAFVLLAAALCFWALGGSADERRVAWYWAGAAVGFLAQPMFVLAYLPLVLLTVCQGLRERHGPRRIAGDAIRMHLVPGLVFAVVYLTTYVGAFNAQGDMLWPAAVKQMASLLLGLPQGGAVGVTAVVLLGALLAAALVWQARLDRWLALFYAVVIVVAPALVLLILRREVVYPRYFLVSALFLVVLASRALAALGRSRCGRIVQAVALAAVIGGNLVATVGLLREGRGNHHSLIDRMVAGTPGHQIRVGSDHNFRTALLLEYYDRRHNAGKELVFVPWQEYVAGDPSTREHILYFYERVLPGSRPTISVERSWQEPPEWFVVSDPPEGPMRGITVLGTRYRLVWRSPSVTLSGQPWVLLQRIAEG